MKGNQGARRRSMYGIDKGDLWNKCGDKGTIVTHLLQDLAESNPTLVEAELQRDTEIHDCAETENADLCSAITDTLSPTRD